VSILALVLLLVVLVLLAVVVAVVVLVVQRKKRDAGLAERARTVDPMGTGPLTSDPRRLKAGDVVTLSGETGDWVVRGTLAMVEDGYRWSEHLLDGSTAEGERRHWLSVEQGESGLELVLWDRVSGSDLTPDSAEVAHGGTAFRRDEKGRARTVTWGKAGYPAVGGPARLGFERFAADGGWEVSAGRVLALESLTILHS